MSAHPRTDQVFTNVNDPAERAYELRKLCETLEDENAHIKSLRIHPDRLLLLDIERGAHRIQLDFKDYSFRVIVNGGVHSTFSARNMTEIPALSAAVEFLAAVEGQSLKYPKPPDTPKP